MGRNSVVLSVGRIIADRIRVEPAEAYAMLEQVWHRLRDSRDGDGAVLPLPALDEMGITAFGDFEMRRSRRHVLRSVRPPHVLTHELASLLLRLLSSGRQGPGAAPQACVEVARRGLTAANPLARPIVTPEAFLRALEAFRPRDASAALGALFARWSRTTDPYVAIGDPCVAAGPCPTSLAETAHEVVVTPPEGASGPTSAADAAAPPAQPVHQPLRAPRLVPDYDVRAPLGSVAEPQGRTWLARVVAAAALGAVLGGASLWQRLQPDDMWRFAEVESRATRPAPSTPPDMVTDRVDAPVTETGMEQPQAATARGGGAPRARRLLHAAPRGRAPYSPSFDPSGDALMFHAGIDRTALLEATLQRDGTVGDVATLIEDGSSNYHAQVSPDGRWIAYDSDADGTRGVYIAARDGSSPRRVSGPGHASVPSWSPDGTSLAFARAEPGRPRVWNVWTLHVPTGRLQRQTNHRVGQPWGASWFPGGERIAYSHEDRLVVRDLRTGASRVYPTPVPGRLVRTPAVSPDGARIVFQVRRDGAWVLDLRTGQSHRLLADASAQEFAWSPDGQRVAYHSVQGGQWGIWVLDLAPQMGP